MSPLLDFICLLLGFFCFVLSALGIAQIPPRVTAGLIPLGLAFWIFVPLAAAFKAAGG